MTITKEKLQEIVKTMPLNHEKVAGYFTTAGGVIDHDVVAIDFEGLMTFATLIAGVAAARPMLDLMEAQEKLAKMAEVVNALQDITAPAKTPCVHDWCHPSGTERYCCKCGEVGE